MTGSTDHTLPGSTSSSAREVALLGCGNMGSAMVRALLVAGHQVVAWNRTAARAEALLADGASVAATAADALTAAPLSILCLSSTDGVRDVLATADPEQLRGRTILNVTSGTPEDAHSLSEYAAELGIAYLDAAIGAYPEQMGTPDARISVAGDEQLWETNRDVICDLAGASIHVGSDVSAANAIDAALTGGFYISSLTAFMEATRFVRNFGVSHEVLAELGTYSVAVLQHQVKLALGRIAADDYGTDEATLNVYADAATTFAAALSKHGDVPILDATAQVLRRGVEQGLGEQDIAAIVDLSS
jgi:3-hydroxyisobutyrate dehydrogenase-like beta-hydroxyacid dehydrogenase